MVSPLIQDPHQQDQAHLYDLDGGGFLNIGYLGAWGCWRPLFLLSVKALAPKGGHRHRNSSSKAAVGLWLLAVGLYGFLCWIAGLDRRSGQDLSIQGITGLLHDSWRFLDGSGCNPGMTGESARAPARARRAQRDDPTSQPKRRKKKKETSGRGDSEASPCGL